MMILGYSLTTVTSNSDMDKPWFFYVVRCSDGSLYAGITTDVRRRVKQHNKGSKGSKYTRSRRPVELVHEEPTASRVSALKIECRFKSLPKSKKESYILGEEPGKATTEVVVRGKATVRRLTNGEGS